MTQSKADLLFSLYIRLRDADENGYVTCCTCGASHHYKDVDAGHFISRIHNTGRYNEKNVHPQCYHCNRFNGGRIAVYEEFLREKYGDDVVDYEILPLKYMTKHMGVVEYTEIVDKYSKEVEMLLKRGCRNSNAAT